MALSRDNLGALALVPPLALGSSHTYLSLAICTVCLIGLSMLGIMAARRRWNLIAPAAYGLLALGAIIITLILEGFWV